MKGTAQGKEATEFKIEIASSVVGGGWATISEGLAEAVRRQYPKSSATVLPSVAPENPIRVHVGDAPLAVSEVTTVIQAMNGEPPYKRKADKVRAIAGIFEGKYTFIITKKTGITSFSDIKDKKYPLRVSTHKKGTLHELLTRAIFEGYGFKLEDIEKWGGHIFHLGFPDSSAMVKDGNLDAFLASSVVPHASIVDLGTVREIRHLSINDRVAELVNKKFGTIRSVIAKGTYSFEDSDVPTIGSILLLIASTDLPDDVAYSTAKALHKNLDYLHGFHRALKDASGDSLVEVGAVPLHPGAEQYYKDAGLIK